MLLVVLDIVGEIKFDHHSNCADNKKPPGGSRHRGA